MSTWAKNVLSAADGALGPPLSIRKKIVEDSEEVTEDGWEDGIGPVRRVVKSTTTTVTVTSVVAICEMRP